jgi:hypothetical protein
MKIHFHKFGPRFIGFFYLLMLVMPTTLQTERAIFLSFILVGTFFLLIRNPLIWKVKNSIFLWMFTCITYSMLSIFWGVLQGAPGALAVSTVYFTWPLLYVYIIGFSKSIDSFVLLQKFLVVGILIASISGVLIVASRFFPELSFLNWYFELLGGRVGVYDRIIEYKLYNMTTVIYGMTFLTAVFFMANNNLLLYSKKWLLFFMATYVLTIFVLFISGRRAFLLVGILAFPLSVLFVKLSRVKEFSIKKLIFKSIKIIILIVTVAIISATTLEININNILKDFLIGFDFNDSTNISAFRRLEQFNVLMGEWQSSPLVGLGHGNATRIGAGDPVPWAYELQYIALLFQTGIAGILIYSAAVIWLIYKMIYILRNDSTLSILIIPSLVGLSCFLIANATNPYLSKFDYLWVLFIPVGLVNVGMVRAMERRKIQHGRLL